MDEYFVLKNISKSSVPLTQIVHENCDVLSMMTHEVEFLEIR